MSAVFDETLAHLLETQVRLLDRLLVSSRSPVCQGKWIYLKGLLHITLSITYKTRTGAAYALWNEQVQHEGVSRRRIYRLNVEEWVSGVNDERNTHHLNT